MMLFLNVFITDQGIMKYNRGLLPPSNRVDIFKYSLASLSVINWTKVIIYYDLDTNYQDRRSEIDEYIKSLFSNPIIYSFRNEHQSQWQVAMKKLFDIDDDLVWFCCNDDHIFIDYDTDLLQQIEDKLINLAKDHKYVSCYFSHWPESLGMINRFKIFKPCMGNIIEHKNYFTTFRRGYESIQIVNKNMLYCWWFKSDFGDLWLPRTDAPHLLWNDMMKVTPITACIVPYREMVRHFDGYSHANIDINVCPPLFIPDGFFENDIKILYCADNNKKGYVNVNPLKQNYTTVDSNGADLKCVLEDLPLFWKDRIVDIDIVKHADRETLLSSRNKAVLEISRQKTLLPVTMLECALRFDDVHISLNEIQKLELNQKETWYKSASFIFSDNTITIRNYWGMGMMFFKNIKKGLRCLKSLMLHPSWDIPCLRKTILKKELSDEEHNP